MKTLSRIISPLTLRIWVIVIFPLAMFYIGLVQVDQYRSTATAAQLDALLRQGHALASSIGLTDAENSPLARQRLSALTAERANQLIAAIPDARIMIFQPDGGLIGDSGRAAIHAPPPITLSKRTPQNAIAQRLEGIAAWASRLISPPADYPVMHEGGSIAAHDFPAVADALMGEAGSLLMRDRDGRLILGVAVPVRNLRVVRGALLVTASGEALERDIRAVENTFFLVFLGTLLVTICLGYYLARSIITPMAHLARAADAVRLTGDAKKEWPQIIGRGDEIGALARDVAAMADELQMRAAATASFAADVAHEIKNPLSSLRSAAESLSKIKDKTKQRKLMEIILADVRRLDRLITDISAASRLDADLKSADFTGIDIAELVRGFGEARMLAKPPRNISVAIEIAQTGKNPLRVRGIAERLVQVLDNLYANAVSFSPDGGVISLRVMRDGGRVIIAMRDEGPGIPEAKREDIFARFYTERPGHEGFGQHSGLGLSISRKIAEIHGGQLTACNIKGGGAELRLALPLIDGA